MSTATADVTDVEFPVRGATLRGKLFRPAGSGGTALPVVVLQGGLGGPAESVFGLTQPFLDAGVACVAYDHRCTGYSDGEPRQLYDPWQMCRDLRDVLTSVVARPDVDSDRIGLWGISLGGANSLFVAALDTRVKALVAIIPPVSGYTARTLQPADTLAELEAQIPLDRLAQLRGEPPVTLRLHGKPTPGNPVMFSDEEGLEFVENMIHDLPSFSNDITLSSLDFIFEMEVGAYAERIAAPLLMVLASQDTVAPVGEAREMFARVPEPKELVEYEGQHYEILSKHFPKIVGRTAQWLATTLL